MAKKVRKVLICGDRNYSKDYVKPIKRVIKKLVEKYGTTNLLIIEGGAPGVDTMVKLYAHRQNVHVAEVSALWAIRRKGAGPQRDIIMLALDPHEVIGIHRNFDESVGTARMLEIAEKAGFKTRRVGLTK